MKDKKALIGYIEILMAGVFSSFGGLFNKNLTAIFPDPKTASFYSLIIAFIALFIFLLVQGDRFGFKIDGKTLFLTFVYGFLTKGLLKICYDYAIYLTGIAMTTILLYTAPIFTFVMSLIFFKEQMTARKTFAVILNIIGCVFVVTQGNFNSLNTNKIGLILGLICGFLYALFTILGKVSTSSINAFSFSFYVFLFSTITVFPIAKPWTTLPMVMNSKYILNAIGYGLLCVVTPNCLLLDGLSRGVDASKAPILSSVEVIVASLLGVMMFSEVLNSFAIGGIAIIVLSIVIMNTEKNTDKL